MKMLAACVEGKEKEGAQRAMLCNSLPERQRHQQQQQQASPACLKRKSGVGWTWNVSRSGRG